MPILFQNFRPEFINRFDAILVYQPLGETQLISLAQRELAKLGDRLNHLGVAFNVQDSVLADLLRPSCNSLFGARPVKRLIATHFEMPIADLIINQQLIGPMTVTGDESWLRQDMSL
jgi:ATP-dependent Clp protease ATP-binding subunit ClpA